MKRRSWPWKIWGKRLPGRNTGGARLCKRNDFGMTGNRKATSVDGTWEQEGKWKEVAGAWQVDLAGHVEHLCFIPGAVRSR